MRERYQSIRRRVMITLIAAALGFGVVQPAVSQRAQADPLPSWNDGPVKKTIIDFVTRVTKSGGPDFVPVEDRIATFDNDGTLWAEKPLPNEVFFVLAHLKEMAAKDPSLKEMIELLAYLRANQFQTWLCSGGTIDFMRVFALSAYGIPPEQVIGSEFKRESRRQSDRLVIW